MLITGGENESPAMRFTASGLALFAIYRVGHAVSALQRPLLRVVADERH